VRPSNIPQSGPAASTGEGTIRARAGRRSEGAIGDGFVFLIEHGDDVIDPFEIPLEDTYEFGLGYTRKAVATERIRKSDNRETRVFILALNILHLTGEIFMSSFRH